MRWSTATIVRPTMISDELGQISRLQMLERVRAGVKRNFASGNDLPTSGFGMIGRIASAPVQTKSRGLARALVVREWSGRLVARRGPDRYAKTGTRRGSAHEDRCLHG